jgi:hypothetical protein
VAEPSYQGVLQERDASLRRRLRAASIRFDAPVAVLWLALAGALAAATTRVVDWFVMTDELLYERLAMSIAQSHSPLPRVHGVLIANISQLYPLLLAPVFSHGLVPSALRDAHALNAFVMSSACIPAFLLTRRVTGRRSLSYLVAALTIGVPWIVLSSLLLTEVVAYPAFVWAGLALQHVLVSRGARADLLALVGIGIAVLARTQFAILLVVLPIALYVHHVAFTEMRPRSWLARLRAAARELVSGHRVLTGVYAALVVSALALVASGRLSSVLGTYSSAATGNVVPHGIGRALLEHLGTIALGAGLLPFLVGVAWMLATIVGPTSRERHAFASIAVTAIIALSLEVSSFDLRFGGGTARDRYLFYLVPLFLVGLAAAVSERRSPRWSLLIPAGVLVVAYLRLPLPRYEKLNVDRPVAAVNDGLIRFAGSPHAARLLLAVGTIVLTVLLLQASALLRTTTLAALLLSLTLAALPAETGYAFSKLFATNGTSGRPITLEQAQFFSWIDQKLGRNARVTMIPYPLLLQDYGSNVGYWWDAEFWNASVQRDAVYGDAYSWTPTTFPKERLSFDATTGRANLSPATYVAQAVADTRFRIAGEAVQPDYRGVLLSRAEQPWRAEWQTSGLFEDGWTRPDAPAKIKVFSEPGQTGPLRRYVTIAMHVPPRTVAKISMSSTIDAWRDDALAGDATHQLAVCVPAHGFAEITLGSPTSTLIYGDPTTADSYARAARHAGVLLREIAVADETASC